MLIQEYNVVIKMVPKGAASKHRWHFVSVWLVLVAWF